jgi:hypothetical protein
MITVLLLSLYPVTGLLFSYYYISKIPGSKSDKITFTLFLSLFGPLAGVFGRIMYLASFK